MRRRQLLLELALVILGSALLGWATARYCEWASTEARPLSGK